AGILESVQVAVYGGKPPAVRHPTIDSTTHRQVGYIAGHHLAHLSEAQLCRMNEKASKRRKRVLRHKVDTVVIRLVEAEVLEIRCERVQTRPVETWKGIGVRVYELNRQRMVPHKAASKSQQLEHEHSRAGRNNKCDSLKSGRLRGRQKR